MPRQFLIFCTIGAVNTGVDFGVYLVLTRTTEFWAAHLVGATALAFLMANTNSYFMNRYWTFRAQQQGKHTEQYPKFLLISLCGLVINTVVFYGLVHGLHSNDILAKVLVAAVVLVWNYTVNKVWTFRHAL